MKKRRSGRTAVWGEGGGEVSVPVGAELVEAGFGHFKDELPHLGVALDVLRDGSHEAIQSLVMWHEHGDGRE